MSYLIDKVLTEKDVVRIEPEKNPVILLFPWIFGVLFIWLLFIPFILAIVKTVKFYNIEYLVTNRKVYEKYGWIATHTDEMPLDKIENIVVEYTFFGKIFNYSVVSIQGTNKNNINFLYVKDGEEIKKQLNLIINK